jgi:hypothetical protein
MALWATKTTINMRKGSQRAPRTHTRKIKNLLIRCTVGQTATREVILAILGDLCPRRAV